MSSKETGSLAAQSALISILYKEPDKTVANSSGTHTVQGESFRALHYA